MIASLQGTLTKKLDRQLILVNQGVGYSITVGHGVLSTAEEGSELTLHIVTRISDETITLYGFSSSQELDFFHQLVRISGIGPKTAMSILDNPISLIQQAIVEENEVFLSSIPGIGKKTAGRLILELKGKITLSMDDISTPGKKPQHSTAEEALEALMSLGYDKASIIRFLNSSPENFSSAEDIVKTFLQHA